MTLSVSSSMLFTVIFLVLFIPNINFSLDNMIRTILPLIIAFSLWFATRALLDNYYYSIPDPASDLSTPGIVFFIEFVLEFIAVCVVLLFHHFYMVPRTRNSIGKILKISLVFVIFFGLLASFGHFYLDNANFVPSIIAGLVVMSQMGSFVFGDIITIGIINNMECEK